MSAPLTLCILLYNSNAVSSWGSADNWRSVNSQWLNLLMPQDTSLSSLQITSSASHGSFSGLVKSQVQQPQFNRSAAVSPPHFCCPVRYSQCRELPATARQHTPALLCLSGLQKAGRWKKHCLLCLTKTKRLLRIQISSWKILEVTLGKLPQHAGRIVSDSSLGSCKAENGAFHWRWIRSHDGSRLK